MRYLPLILLLTFSVLGSGCTRQAKLDRAMKRGRTHLEAGELEKAKLTYLSVLKSDPKNSEAIKQLGQVWAAEGAPLPTAVLLSKAKEFFPNDGELRATLARALFSLGRTKEARIEAGAALDLAPQHEQALLLLAETSRTPEDEEDLEARLARLPADGANVLLARAASCTRKGDFESAEAAVRSALEKAPDSSSAHSASGMLMARKNDKEGAKAAFKKASELGAAGNPATQLLYARFLIELAEYAEASSCLEELAGKHPESVPLWLTRAQLAVQMNDQEAANKHLDRLSALDPGNFEAGLLRAQLLLRGKDPEKAIAVLEGLIRSPFYANAAKPRFELSRAYLQSGNTTRAVTLLEEAIKLEPDYLEALIAVGELKLQQGDLRGAADAAKTINSKRPDWLPGQLLTSRVEAADGKPDVAIARLRKQIEINPKAYEPHLQLGLILLQQKNLDEAKASLEAAARLAPRNLQVAEYLVNVDLLRKDSTSALKVASELAEQLPSAAAPQLFLARVFLVAKQWDKAEAALDRCIALDPNYAGAYELLLPLYLSSKRLDTAEAKLQEFLKQSPKNAGALISLGMTQEALQKFELAKATYERALEVKTDAPVALNNLANLYAERFGDIGKAAELATRAHTGNPADPVIADTLGWIAFRQGDYDKAFSLLQESVKKAGDHPEVQYHFAKASYMTGRANLAREAFTKAASASVEFPGKSEIPDALAALETGDKPESGFSEEKLKQMLTAQPGDPVIRQYLSDRFERAKAFVEAAALWKDALKLNANNITALVKLTDLYSGPLNDPKQALEYAKKARALAPSDSALLARLGRASYQSGDYVSAYRLIKEVGRSTALDAEGLNGLGRSAYALSKVAEARETMKSLEEKFPNEPLSIAAKTFAALTSEDPSSLLTPEELKKEASGGPNQVPALMAQGGVDERQGRSADAQRAYEQALSLLPGFGLAEWRLAAIFAKENRTAEAVRLATDARKSLPDEPQLKEIVAVGKYSGGEYAAALPLLQEAGRQPTARPELLYYEGLCRLKLKQEGEGRAALLKALDRGLAGAPADEARRLLAEDPVPVAGR